MFLHQNRDSLEEVTNIRFWELHFYLLCHVGLRKIVEDKSDLLLDILWWLYNSFCLVSGHQQCVNVGCVY